MTYLALALALVSQPANFSYWDPAPGMGHSISGPIDYLSPENGTTYGTWTTSSWDKDTYLVPDPDEVQVRFLWVVTDDPSLTYPSVGDLVAGQPVQQSIDTSTGIIVYSWTYLLEPVPGDTTYLRYVRIKWHDTVWDLPPVEEAADGGMDGDQWAIRTVTLRGASSSGSGGTGGGEEPTK